MKTNKMLTLSQAVGLIFKTKGRIFNAVFIKRSNGETRSMNCRLNVTKHLKGGQLNYNPALNDLLPVFDMDKKGYKMINLTGLLTIKINGKTYEVVQ